jgi:hypothetical protein
MSSDLHEGDIQLWSERQADLLRRRGAGELVNERELDWPNIAEEIEHVGRSELRSCRSLLRLALRQMLKAEAWPLSRDARARRPARLAGRPGAAAYAVELSAHT